MTSVSGLSESLIRTSAREICVLIILAHTKKVFEPIYKKYSTNKYLKVAQIPVQIREEAQQKKANWQWGVSQDNDQKWLEPERFQQ